MLYKFALSDPQPVEHINGENIKMIRTASGRVLIEPGSEKENIVKAAIKKHPNALFFRAKAIEADVPNSNGDSFPLEELKKAYKSFEGVPFFTNHDNQNVENAKGKIIFAEWIPEDNAAYTIAFVDRDAYPHICRGIEEGYMTGVSMGAISGGSMILMADGTERAIEDLVAGDEVVSHNGNVNLVSSVHNEYLGKDMYEFVLSTYHKSPLFTNDHPIFSISNDEIVCENNLALKVAKKYMNEQSKDCTSEFVCQDGWRNKKYNPSFKKAEAVSKGDYFLVPSKFNLIDGESDNSDLYYLMGVYLGDGYLKKDRKGQFEAISFCLGDDNFILAEKITNLLKKYSSKENISSKLVEERNGLHISVYDRELANLFANYFGTGSKSKRIKFKVKYVEDAKNLIAGYLDTDECIVDKTNQDSRENNCGGFQISSENIGLLEDIQSLLIALGFISRLSTFDRAPSKQSVGRFNAIENTLVIDLNDSSVFDKSIKHYLSDVTRSDIKDCKSFIYCENNRNYMACQVKDVNIIPFDEPVYDLTVENDASYIADGLAIHNCSVEYSVCNICSNRAERTEDYCTHIRNRKGRKFSGKVRDVISGEVKEFHDEPVFEYNYGIKFIELSAVVDPACPSCHIQGIIPNESYLSKVACLENELRMVKTAAMQKEAGQEEINQINQVLETLENIAINLIQNREQVEVEFASDLVEILSNLQTWLDELVGAGYGNVQSSVPGTAEAPTGEQEGALGMAPRPEEGMSQGNPAQGAPPATMPVAAESDMAVGSISGQPNKPLVNTPQMPITAPMKPAASSRTIQRIADEVVEPKNRFEIGTGLLQKAASLCDKINKTGEEKMGKRRTVANKNEQKQKTMDVLSKGWQEKQHFFKYIREVPSLQDNHNKLSVKQRDDSFIIVAESKSEDNPHINIWTYEDLTDDEKELIMESPRMAAASLLESFANQVTLTREGVERMSKETKEAGANTVLPTPEVVQEKQLDQSGLYHGRTGDEKHEITQKQLESKRNGEKDYLTEKQLDDPDLRLNPRQDDEVEVITEAQLTGDNRKNEDKETITEKQLSSEGYRTNSNPEVITEKQLDSIPDPWKRMATRDSAKFKTASDHMKAVINVFAETSLETGATPQEMQEISRQLVAGTKARYQFASTLLDKSEVSETLPFSKRVAYWNAKNVRVATASPTEVEHSLMNKLRVVASDETMNPEVIIDAVDVVSDGELGSNSISKRIDEKMAEVKENTTAKVSVKKELFAALEESVKEVSTTDTTEKIASKEERDAKRNEILASLQEMTTKTSKTSKTAKKDPVLNRKAIRNADTIIETSFDEVGIQKGDPSFKRAISVFAKGALAANEMKLASITNVTIQDNTIQIAVQTEAGEESVNIPIGAESSPEVEEVVPEGDLSGEGLEDTFVEEEVAPTPAYASSKKKIRKQAQSPMGGGVPGTPGGVAAPGAPDAGMDAPMPEMDAIETLTTGGEDDLDQEIPTVGEKQAPWSICPECGAADVDVTKENDGGIIGNCNACGAEYEALVKKTVEFTIIKPTKSVGEDGEEIPEGPEEPEIPALPVAAQTKLDKNSIVRIAQNRKTHGEVCPSCGKDHCKVKSSKEGSVKCACQACGTTFNKDIIISSKNPKAGLLRVAWQISPSNSCPECKKEAVKFASKIKVGNMLRTAQANSDKFPMANCVERLAREYGGNTVAMFGPCKDKNMANCVCKELQKLGFTKVRQLKKLASASMQIDPMDECIEDQKKRGHDVVEAKSICGCIKKKFANELSDNIYAHAFMDEVQEGKIGLTKADLITLDEMFKNEQAEIQKKAQVMMDSEEIGDDLPALDNIEVEVDEIVDEPELEEIEEAPEVASVTITGDNLEIVENSTDGDEEILQEDVEFGNDEDEEDVVVDEIQINDEDALAEALAMNSSRVRRSGESSLRLAGKPTQIKTIEKDVEAGVPRAKATIGHEGADNIDVPLNKPQVPRAKATMGNESAENIDVSAGLPDVAVDSSYMGVEKSIQQGMPAINNEIKGTVIADTKKNKKEAKKMKEIETVENDVEAGVPRAKATMGHEGTENIDVPLNKPKVPRAKATMGNEGSDNIDVPAGAPDVPVDNAYMGVEKEVQQGMPGINDEMLKQVQQKRNQQIERIASARKEEARNTAAWLAASGRIANDRETFNNVVTALSTFEVDRIASIAETMFPARQTKTASAGNAVKTAGYSVPAIVLESTPPQEQSLQDKLSSTFTMGTQQLDKTLRSSGER